MRQLAVQRTFLEPARELPINADSRAIDFNQLLLLAIERALAPPIVHRRSTFQPMRVVVVNPELISRTNTRDESHREMPRPLPRTLPHAARVSGHAMSRIHQRAVRGEILSDESGRLFEKLGRQIRPIHQLASGPFGEVIDLVPLEQSSLPMIAPPSRPKLVDPPERETALSGSENAVASTADSPTSQFVPLQELTEQTKLVSHRKLFADPGQWRVLWWGEFKEILSRQLAHPERLRDTYRLPCYVQVLETERAVSVEELAKIYKSENERAAGLYFLSDETAAKLDLVLPLRPAPPPNAKRAPNTLLPHERVFRLMVANDPTVDIANSKSKIQSSAAKREVDAEVKGSEPASASPALKDTIPARFVKDWEFKISREEASYDMSAKPGMGSLIRGFCRRLRTTERSHEVRKWQTLLAGKETDEQLWAVRPPAGRLGDSLVREWAAKTLELGSYDRRKMINEWEIFWRRKGV